MKTPFSDYVFSHIKKNPSLAIIIWVLEKHLVPQKNFLLKSNDTPYKLSDLKNEMGISMQAASLALKKLKEINVIAKMKTEYGDTWVMNPFIMFHGNEFPLAVVKMFEKYSSIIPMEIADEEAMRKAPLAVRPENWEKEITKQIQNNCDPVRFYYWED